jgi:hypothetical protein
MGLVNAILVLEKSNGLSVKGQGRSRICLKGSKRKQG